MSYSNILYQDEKLTLKEFMECLEEVKGCEGISSECLLNNVTCKHSYNEDILEQLLEDKIIRSLISKNNESTKCQHCTRGFQRLSETVLELLQQQINEELTYRTIS